jgi:hypothetical protein
MAVIRRGLVALGWLAAAGLIALGAAGIVAGMEGPASDPVRSGRTVADDARVVAALEPIEADLRSIGDAVDGLGRQARGALAALSANDPTTAETAITTGTGLLAAVEPRIEAVRGALGDVPLVGDPSAVYRLSPDVQARAARAAEALAATDGLEADWTRLTAGSLSAIRLSRLLAQHDEAVVAAAAKGRDADYDEALTTLDGADQAIAAARTMRNQLAATVDVTTLDAWLGRSEDYDRALRRLYETVRAANGTVTPAVRDAIKAEEAAKARLPPDTRALVLIMADIGRGRMNDAAIAIEQAYTDLLDALAVPLDVPAP